MVSQKCYEIILEGCKRHQEKRVERERLEGSDSQPDFADDLIFDPDF
jgi:hypothetical protein